MNLKPYVFFDGRCEEAMEFYKKAVGAKVNRLMRYKEAPDQSMISPGSADKVMHCDFQIGDTVVLGSDGRNTGHPKFEGFALTLHTATEAEADRTFAALSEGGQATMPLSKTFFSPKFGMLTDKFGVHWMVIVEH